MAVELPEWYYNVDVHTHVPAPDGRAIVSATPGQGLGSAPYYSVGIHPWEADASQLAALETIAADKRVVAIGECGLDKLRGPDMQSVQMPVFVAQAQLAEKLGKPLIIHCVRAYGEVMTLHRRMQPSVPWIMHGFNRSDNLARQLTEAGIYLSIPAGKRIPAVDPRFILHETDALQ